MTYGPISEIVSGLQFPEGPIAMPDGSFVLVEMRRQSLSRVWNGKIEPIAILGGGPNGAAIGPDGAAYVCNNGGLDWAYHPDHGYWPSGRAKAYIGGSIDRVDLATGKWERLYTTHDQGSFSSPNDIVFDAHGGFWFTDAGGVAGRQMFRGGIYYALPDGSRCTEVIFPLTTPNGIGLSPDGKTLYTAETLTGRVWAFDITGPGEIRRAFAPGEVHTPDRSHILAGAGHGRLVAGPGGFTLFDSLAVDSAGNICPARLVNGAITVISPDGSSVEHVPIPDTKTTNICFGGPELRTAYVTASSSSRLLALQWPRPGLGLNYLNS